MGDLEPPLTVCTVHFLLSETLSDYYVYRFTIMHFKGVNRMHRLILPRLKARHHFTLFVDIYIILFDSFPRAFFDIVYMQVLGGCNPKRPLGVRGISTHPGGALAPPTALREAVDVSMTYSSLRS